MDFMDIFMMLLCLVWFGSTFYLYHLLYDIFRGFTDDLDDDAQR
jgi:hypothetical protein